MDGYGSKLLKRFAGLSGVAVTRVAATGVAMLLAGAAPPPASIPGVLAPPPGNLRFLSARATGTQNYVCLPAVGTAPAAWRLLGPQAVLSASVAGVPPDLAEHGLAAVPGTAPSPSPGCTEAAAGSRQYCPSWRSPTDGSTVWGAKSASVAAGSDPACPDKGSIACLLLRAVATSGGPRPPGLFSRTTFIQRLDTSGGGPPDAACTAGQVALVPYQATYRFYARGP